MNKTYYDVSKWGDKSKNEPIKANMITLLEELLELKIDLENPKLELKTKIEDSLPINLDPQFENNLRYTVGDENVSSVSQDRIERATGKSYFDAINMRKNNINKFPDFVVFPKNENEVLQIIQLCNSKAISITPMGGRSSVTQGFDFENGGIALDLTKHMKRIINLDILNQSVTVEAGIYGPEFEQYLNEYHEGHDVGYTCGHFPQSFEFSTVGGWLAARGAGQESTGYGKIENMVLGLRMVTPQGVISVKEFPARSTGPDIIQIIIGSEGSFGIITEVTMKIYRRYPKNTKYFAYLFKDWTSSITAVREMMQQRIGYPSVFRVSDPEETYISIETIGLPSWQEKFLQLMGFYPHKRTLLMGTLEGNESYTKMMKKQIKKIAKSQKGFSLGASAVKHWLETRYSSAYLRDSFISAGIVLDTLETSCTWANIDSVWRKVRETIKQRPNTILMSHLSHIYENGANLYFIFIFKAIEGEELEDFAPFHKKIVEKIIESGGSLSHHHGIGSLLSPYLEKEIGTAAYDLLKAMKKHLDPHNILNPGILFDKQIIPT